jgi:hypothetical protein
MGNICKLCLGDDEKKYNVHSEDNPFIWSGKKRVPHIQTPNKFIATKAEKHSKNKNKNKNRKNAYGHI